jgi:hypothetical protein
MAPPSPGPLTPAERRARRNRAAQIARWLEFVGNVEYRHVYSQTGGAQYCRGTTPEEDLLILYAEAFDRDADDFSLKAMISHDLWDHWGGCYDGAHDVARSPGGACCCESEWHERTGDGADRGRIGVVGAGSRT